MKTSKHTKKILNQLENSLEKETLITGNPNCTESKAIHDECLPLSANTLPPFLEKVLCNLRLKTSNVIKIDVMSLHHRRHTTAGLYYPRPLCVETVDYSVHEGDTWENLAERTAYDLEILLRVNGVPAEKVYDILDKKATTADIHLKIGQTIKLPLKVTQS